MTTGFIVVFQDVKGFKSAVSKNQCYCVVPISQSKFASLLSKNLPAKEFLLHFPTE